MTSLRASLGGIGVAMDAPVALRGSFGRRTPHSLRVALEGMTNPKVGAWKNVAVALASENTDLAEEAQGVTTDGKHWYVCSNNTKNVVVFDDAANRVATLSPNAAVIKKMWEDAGSPTPHLDVTSGFPTVEGVWDPHFGAPSFHDGWISVPIQGPRGVWRIRTDGSEQHWKMAKDLPEDDLFAWCAIHPVNGLLYTCNSSTTRPKKVRAYDPITLERRPDDDIRLGKAPHDLHRVQGGTFTARGRLKLDNDAATEGSDDFYLHSYSIPHPDLL